VEVHGKVEYIPVDKIREAREAEKEFSLSLHPLFLATVLSGLRIFMN
jgi:hypothetical protein